jgi:hypothetical protein
MLFLRSPGGAAPRALRARNYFELILIFVLENDGKNLWRKPLSLRGALRNAMTKA